MLFVLLVGALCAGVLILLLVLASFGLISWWWLAAWFGLALACGAAAFVRLLAGSSDSEEEEGIWPERSLEEEQAIAQIRTSLASLQAEMRSRDWISEFFGSGNQPLEDARALLERRVSNFVRSFGLARLPPSLRDDPILIKALPVKAPTLEAA